MVKETEPSFNADLYHERRWHGNSSLEGQKAEVSF